MHRLQGDRGPGRTTFTLLNERLKEALAHRGLMQVDVARAIGVSRQRVSQLVRGEGGRAGVSLSIETLLKIAKAVDVDPLWLVDEKVESRGRFDAHQADNPGD